MASRNLLIIKVYSTQRIPIGDKLIGLISSEFVGSKQSPHTYIHQFGVSALTVLFNLMTSVWRPHNNGGISSMLSAGSQ